MGSEFKKLEQALATQNEDKIKPYIRQIPGYLKIRSTRQRKIRIGRVLKSRDSKAIEKISKKHLTTFAENPRGIEKIITSCCAYAINIISVLTLRDYLYNPDLTARQKNARALLINKSKLAPDRKEVLQIDDLPNCNASCAEPANNSPKNITVTQPFNFQPIVRVSSGIHLNNNDSTKKIAEFINMLFSSPPKIAPLRHNYLMRSPKWMLLKQIAVVSKVMIFQNVSTIILYLICY